MVGGGGGFITLVHRGSHLQSFVLQREMHLYFKMIVTFRFLRNIYHFRSIEVAYLEVNRLDNHQHPNLLSSQSSVMLSW